MTGVALRLVAILCLSTMSAVVKLAEARGALLAESLFYRQLLAVPVAVAWVAAGPGLGTLRTARLGGHVTRTAVGLIGMVFNFSAVLLLPLAEATTMQFTVPIFATLLGALVLHERTGWHRWSAVLAGFLGVLVVAQPGHLHIPLAGLGVGMGGAFFVALIAILLRQLGRTENAGTIVFWFSLLSVPPLGIAYALYAQPHPIEVWAMFAAIGVAGGIGQLALTGALRYAPVSAVVPMDYSALIWSTFYGWALFGAWPTTSTWLGAPLIAASGLYIVWREHRLGKRESPVTAADTPA